jgi:hypothetical protein
MKVSDLMTKEETEKARNTGKQLAALMVGKTKPKVQKPQLTFTFSEFVNK